MSPESSTSGVPIHACGESSLDDAVMFVLKELSGAAQGLERRSASLHSKSKPQVL